MIARMWRGATTRADAVVYARYVAETGLVAYRATSGNRGAHILQRDVGELTEIITLSFWDSLEAIKDVAGDDIERAAFSRSPHAKPTFQIPNSQFLIPMCGNLTLHTT